MRRLARVFDEWPNDLCSMIASGAQAGSTDLNRSQKIISSRQPNQSRRPHPVRERDRTYTEDFLDPSPYIFEGLTI